MAIALVSNTGKGAAAGGDSITTDAIDTTGATLLVIVLGFFNSTPTISDSKSNTWTALTNSHEAAGSNCQIFYVANPTVGSGHTFTNGTSDSYSSVLVSAWSGAATTTPFDQQNQNNAGPVTSASTGSITPGENNELVIAGVSLRDNGSTGDTVSINGGFTISDQVPSVGFAHLQGASAYLIQTTAAAANPTWSWTNSDYVATTIASFKAAGGGASVVPILMRQYRARRN